MFLKLAARSLVNRKGSVALTILAMSVSIFVLLGVEHIRNQAKESFSNTVSGVDLVVGARSSSLNLLLYSVFRIGSPTNNIRWNTYQTITDDPNIDWAVPISLGDSHKGYRVMGTTEDYFEHYRYGKKQQLAFKGGQAFGAVFDVVLGHEVAQALNYQLGDEVVLAHGIATKSFSLHKDRPFTIVGILKPTGTPIDRTLHVSLAGIEAIHLDWQNGVNIPGSGKEVPDEHLSALQPSAITAFMVGLKSRIATFKVQRKINQYKGEPLMAILPGVALSELWGMMALLENTLRLVSLLVLVAALLGLSSMLLASMRERKHEIQLLRMIGASPAFIFLLLQLEALIISLLSIALGAGGLTLCLVFMNKTLSAQFGLFVSENIHSLETNMLMALVVVATVIAALIPAVNAYRTARNR